MTPCMCCRSTRYDTQAYGERDICSACALQEAVTPTTVDVEEHLRDLFTAVFKGVH